MHAQEDVSLVVEVAADTIVYNKNTNISNQKTFTTNLKETYTGKEFEYKEPSQPETPNPTTVDSSIIKAFVFFMTRIFPFLLAAFIIFIILKAILGFDVKFWKSIKPKQPTTKKLIYEDEDIHQTDLKQLLQQAIDNQNYRLAIRYYYLISLKGLSTKKLIDYHKDKTNSEYLFEIENTELRSQFSYLSYVYTYVWYGEFSVDETHFKAAQNKYQSFINNLY